MLEVGIVSSGISCALNFSGKIWLFCLHDYNLRNDHNWGGAKTGVWAGAGAVNIMLAIINLFLRLWKSSCILCRSRISEVGLGGI